MTQKSDWDIRSKLPSTPVLVVLGSALICFLLIVWIFAPYGLLDSLTHSQGGVDTTIEDMLANQQAPLPEALSAEKNAAFLAENAKKPGVKSTASGLRTQRLSRTRSRNGGANGGPRLQRVSRQSAIGTAGALHGLVL